MNMLLFNGNSQGSEKAFMKKIFLVLLLVGQIAANAQDQKISTFILVRHAEKASDGKDPELSQGGAERAQRLALLLKNSEISAVYSTKYKRTQNTVGPVSKEKNLVINDYESMTGEQLQKIANENPGGTVLIAGHSNTVPQIANALLGKNQFQNFPDSEYGTILVLSVLEVGKVASVLRLNY
jgi:2,3-bisphosphoglycerate-dependent phosphoglycerate mutase